MDTLELIEMVKDARQAALVMGGMDAAARDAALAAMYAQLDASRATIEAANRKDKQAAEQAGLEAPLLKRLDIEGKKFDGMLQKVTDVRAIADPVGGLQLATEIDDNLHLYRVACPIGVIAVIFESRPEAAVQISALALKSANAVILKGGKEAANTNAALVAAIQAGLASPKGNSTLPPPQAVQLVSSREEVSALLALHGQVDLVIPRGSNALVAHIMANTRIPVMGHADGICSVYIDSEADVSTAVRVAVDSKCDYPVACNAAETLLVHQSALTTVWRAVAEALLAKGVALRCDSRSLKALPAEQQAACSAAVEADFHTEFLALEMAVKCVESVSEAVTHINAHSSHHTDAIVSASKEAIQHFTSNVDSAGVYANASTRFADGQRYGFGAEVGVSTNRIHSRGPMGVEGLLIYKYLLYGRGHCAADYGAGGKTFKHAPLPLTARGVAAAGGCSERFSRSEVAAAAAAVAAAGAACFWLGARMAQARK